MFILGDREKAVETGSLQATPGELAGLPLNNRDQSNSHQHDSEKHNNFLCKE